MWNQITLFLVLEDKAVNPYKKKNKTKLLINKIEWELGSILYLSSPCQIIYLKFINFSAQVLNRNLLSFQQ